MRSWWTWRKPVTNAASLARVRGLPRPVEQSEGRNMVEAIQRGLAAPEAEWPAMAPAEETPAERFAVDSLWAIVQSWCHGHRVDPNLVCSRHDIGKFHRHFARDGTVPESRLLRGWRAEFLGQPLLEMLRGERRLGMRWDNGAVAEE